MFWDCNQTRTFWLTNQNRFPENFFFIYIKFGVIMMERKRIIVQQLYYYEQTIYQTTVLNIHE